jgi:hypothetical protein
MFVVKRNGVLMGRAADSTEAEEIVCDSGEVSEGAWEQIVPRCLSVPERVLWTHGGWSVERIGL